MLSDEADVTDPAIKAAQLSLGISTVQYRGGLTNYLQAITAQTSALQNERSAVEILTRRMVASQTAGMRSGFVRLKPGRSVGWHSTGQNEESLIILHGEGDALIDGQAKRGFSAPQFLYILPATRHNLQNSGPEALEYVYVVAPAPGK